MVSSCRCSKIMSPHNCNEICHPLTMVTMSQKEGTGASNPPSPPDLPIVNKHAESAAPIYHKKPDSRFSPLELKAGGSFEIQYWTIGRNMAKLSVTLEHHIQKRYFKIGHGSGRISKALGPGRE